MQYQEVIQELEAAGSEQTRKTYRRHGVPDPMFGVSIAVIEKLKKRIKVDQALADQLWASGNADARILGAMIADPAQMATDKLDEWVLMIDCNLVAHYFGVLAARTPHNYRCLDGWLASENEMTARTAWNMVGYLALTDASQDDAYFEGLLPKIEADIHGARNWVKEGMNGALIAIGTRCDVLEQMAIASSRRIGKVTVDQGDTACKTPDAEPYIIKASARRRAKAEKVKAKG